MKVFNIFKSIVAEGPYAGTPASYIQLYGCNLDCNWCGVRCICRGKKYTDMHFDSILDILEGHNLELVVITGGEPLIQPALHNLVNRILELGYQVNIETNGSKSIQNFCSNLDIGLWDLYTDVLTFTVNYKLPSSGGEPEMLMENLIFSAKYPMWCANTFTVGSPDDLPVVKRVIKQFALERCFLSAVYDIMGGMELADWLLHEANTDIADVVKLCHQPRQINIMPGTLGLHKFDIQA